MTVTFLEWTAFVVNLAGLLFIGSLMRDAMDDYFASRPEVLERLGLTNARRGLYAAMYVRNRALFIFIHAMNVVASVAGILTPDPEPVPPVRYLSIFIFITFSFIIDLFSLLDLRDRRRIKTYVGAEERSVV